MKMCNPSVVKDKILIACPDGCGEQRWYDVSADDVQYLVNHAALHGLNERHEWHKTVYDLLMAGA
jgi:hypothetical protein